MKPLSRASTGLSVELRFSARFCFSKMPHRHHKHPRFITNRLSQGAVLGCARAFYVWSRSQVRNFVSFALECFAHGGAIYIVASKKPDLACDVSESCKILSSGPLEKNLQRSSRSGVELVVEVSYL
eukprot:5812738-Amphidinium_carterae.1